MEQIKKHDGYIVPFDIPSESLKKGDILRHKNGLDDDMYENIVILNSSYCLPPEWVETWEKYYQEEVKQVTAVNYLIHSIHEDMFQLSKTEAEWKEIFEQAKQMDKQQIIDAWHKGYDNQSPMIDEENCGQTYYTSTYGSKGSDELHEDKLVEIPTSSQTEISDEEIEKAAKEWYEKEGIVNYKAEIRAWAHACKWYREQLKQKI